MGVVEAKIQTVEDMYRLVRLAVIGKRPIRATYQGRNHEGQLRVRCYQYAG